ncbi:hypothetical protein ABW20_dc0107432 [Dactylellina cionopaga]|nr:hypothetical protein ABW20_dc0107432 [Dactylellina cionopaga]
MGSQKKPSFLKRTKINLAIQHNALMALLIRVVLARVLPSQKIPNQDLTGKNAIVTGANTGLGKAMALSLAKMNANVYLACRNLTKAEAAKEDLLKSVPGATIHVRQLDTSTLENCRKFCDDWAADGSKTVDIIMHNAGIGCPPSPDNLYGPDGFEHMYMTNFLSNFLITYMLEKYFAPDAKLVMTASPGCFVGGFTNDFAKQSTRDVMEPGYHYPKGKKPQNSMLYSNGKLMQLCLTSALMKKWKAEGKGYTAFAFNPGYVASEFFDKDGVKGSSAKSDPIWWILRNGFSMAMTSEEGCKTGVMLATNPSKKVAATAGRFYERMKVRTSLVDLYDDTLLERLWDRWCLDANVKWESGYRPKDLASEGSIDESTTTTTEK